jgi:polyhydroxybutyrate depolymerase
MLTLILAAQLQAGLRPITLSVAGVERQLLAYSPKNAEKAPIVFVFHGHGGTGRSMARRLAIHELWPEAVVLYPQGLPTAGKFDPEGKKAGWQKGAGTEGDRDLKFFDAIISELAKRKLGDPGKVFVTGHSNGGGFTYLLWGARDSQVAAVAPSAAGGNVFKLQPKPCLHIAGEKDTRVPYENQRRVMDAVLKLNGAATTGTPWMTLGTWHDSKDKNPFVEVVHPGGHEIPAKTGEWIVAFFKTVASRDGH